MELRSGNPVLSRGFEATSYAELAMGASRSSTMTVQGTIIKAAFLLALTLISGGIGWSIMVANPGVGFTLWLGGSVVGFLVALVLCFWRKGAMFLSPIYALAQGLAVGGLTFFLANRLVDGGKASSALLFAAQALILTFAIFGGMLAAYSFKIVRLGSTAMKVVSTLTMGVALFSVIMLVLYMLNIGRDFTFSIFSAGSGSLLGIGFSLFIVILAAFRLVMDFQFIEEGVASNQPKYMEWYGAFGLMVTLIWLYVEVLRLLSKLRNR